MTTYLIRRLLLLPLTLFCILLVNFVIINMAPGDPSTVSSISPDGNKQEKDSVSAADDRFLQFREHYGLTLPLLMNTWPWAEKQTLLKDLRTLTFDKKTMPVKEYDALKIRFGDRARYTMPLLLAILEDPVVSLEVKQTAARFFIRGGTMQALLGPNRTKKEKAWNELTAKNNLRLRDFTINPSRGKEEAEATIKEMRNWFAENNEAYRFQPTEQQKVRILFFETRFFRYFSKILTLDFGSLRNDPNRTVISEVTKRFKYSLTLSVLPMAITFVFCQFFGFIMALKQSRWQDFSLNLIFLVLYAVPVFVVAPFLIEKVAMGNTWPGTDIPIPLGGFTSSEAVYETMTSKERLFDIMQHIALPLVAILYGSLASQARLSRTAVLEVLRQDYVRTARAKGLSTGTILVRHVGRNAAITIVTSIAGSLGILLGGSLIVETLFDINGFGKFFYEAVLNRDYNVILFSAMAGSFLALMGYLAADIAYTLLDPRVTLD